VSAVQTTQDAYIFIFRHLEIRFGNLKGKIKIRSLNYDVLMVTVFSSGLSSSAGHIAFF
jgi:hypothetical protein